MLTISCSIESELSQLPDEDRQEFMADLGMTEPGLHRLFALVLICLA